MVHFYGLLRLHTGGAYQDMPWNFNLEALHNLLGGGTPPHQARVKLSSSILDESNSQVREHLHQLVDLPLLLRILHCPVTVNLARHHV